MKAVPCIDMISSGNVSEHSMKNLADIVRTIDEQEDALVAHLNTYGDVASAFESSKFKVGILRFSFNRTGKESCVYLTSFWIALYFSIQIFSLYQRWFVLLHHLCLPRQ